jgi:hypothetical protein
MPPAPDFKGLHAVKSGFSLEKGANTMEKALI